MNNQSTPRYTVTLLPWLRLSDLIEINDVVFWSFPDEAKIFKLCCDIELQLRRIVSSYCDLTGKPVHILTIASFKDEMFKDLTESEAARLGETIRLLAFSAMAENDYYRQAGNYFNSTHFQYFHQRFQLGSTYIAPESRRRDGATSHGGYRHGELRFSMPLEVSTGHETKVNLDLLRTLSSYLTQNTPETVAMRNSINWFLLANSDSNSTTVEAETIMMGSAFESLLQVQDQRKKKKALMNKLSKLFVGRLTKKAEREGTDRRRAKKSWKVWWVDEFYWLRSKFTHGGNVEKRVWSVQEHLVIAAMILAIGAKLKLANLGLYTLSSHDETSADAIDFFIADGGLSEDKLLDARQDASLSRATEKAWKHFRGKIRKRS